MMGSDSATSKKSKKEAKSRKKDEADIIRWCRSGLWTTADIVDSWTKFSWLWRENGIVSSFKER